MKNGVVVAIGFLFSFGIASAQINGANNACVSVDHTISFGSTGSDVTTLQQFLGVAPSGYFGAITKQKLTAWQVSHAVIRTARSEGAGTTGPRTRAALRCSNAPVVPVATSTTQAKILSPNSGATSTGSIIPVVLPHTSNPSGSGSNAVPGGGGGGGSAAVPATPAVSQCPVFKTPKPPASQCTTGTWQIIQDEAGCDVEWDCSNPTDFRG